jgi:2,3-bisphosphoglycerate-independent phosphoglycerate mutase
MTARPSPPRPLVLCVLDGFGERAEREGNAVRLAETPALDALSAGPRALLAASGVDVGLPKNQPGTGEAGYASLGSGRVIASVRSRLDALIAERALDQNLALADVMRIAKHHFAARLHLFGLLEAASLPHLTALIDLAHRDDTQVVVHAVLDGRDAAPRSAGPLLDRLEHFLDRGRKGVIGSIGGRSFAMDEEGRWERVHKAYEVIVRGRPPRADTVQEALGRAYDLGKTDADVEPLRIGAYSGMKGEFMCNFTGGDQKWRWFGEENGLFFGSRLELFRPLAAMFFRKGVPAEVEEKMLTDRDKAVFAFIKGALAGMSAIDPALAMASIFPAEPAPGTLGEALAEAGKKQIRVAAEDARAHVTTHFDAGRAVPFAGEERAFTAPAEVAKRAAAIVAAGGHDFVLVSLSAADRAAHGGDLEATVRAVEEVDAGLALIAEATRTAGGALAVTAAHGGCERMQDASGQPWPGHTQAAVPFHLVDPSGPRALAPEGRLADVAPTLLDLLGIAVPEAMTGRSLLR